MTDQITIDTYNKSAQSLAAYFRGIGSRAEEIQETLKLAGNPNKPRILEIGCGDGRDAKEIIKYAGWYLGFDISKELIKLAKKYVPSTSFVVADAVTFVYPTDIDIVFAFASLLHLDKAKIKAVLGSLHKALNSGGLVYISLKYAPTYEKRIKEDRFGTRTFHFYNPDIITELAGEKYEVIQKNIIKHRGNDWFSIVLKKV